MVIMALTERALSHNITGHALGAAIWSRHPQVILFQLRLHKRGWQADLHSMFDILRAYGALRCKVYRLGDSLWCEVGLAVKPPGC